MRIIFSPHDYQDCWAMAEKFFILLKIQIANNRIGYGIYKLNAHQIKL